MIRKPETYWQERTEANHEVLLRLMDILKIINQQKHETHIEVI